MTPSKPDSIWDEPQMRVGPARPDPSEFTSDPPEVRHPLDQAGDSVWDEPNYSGFDVPQNDRNGWAQRYLDLAARTGNARSWLITLALALVAGPLGIATAFFGSGEGSVIGVIYAITFGPVIEELGKNAAGLLAAETRPHLFKNPVQIILLGLAGGLVFAVIENFMYLYVYIPNPSDAVIQWRWTVCTAMHVTCSGIAAAGVANMWSKATSTLQRPRYSDSVPFFIVAMVLHAGYNLFAIVFSLLGGMK